MRKTPVYAGGQSVVVGVSHKLGLAHRAVSRVYGPLENGTFIGARAACRRGIYIRRRERPARPDGNPVRIVSGVQIVAIVHRVADIHDGVLVYRPLNVDTGIHNRVERNRAVVRPDVRTAGSDRQTAESRRRSGVLRRDLREGIATADRLLIL